MATCASRGCASTGGGAHCSEEGCEEGRLSSREEEDDEPEVAEVQSTCSIRSAVPVVSSATWPTSRLCDPVKLYLQAVRTGLRPIECEVLT